MPAATSAPSSILFGDLLEALRQQRFEIGVDRYARILELIELIGNEVSPQQLKTLLCPLVATSHDEQQQFYRIFDQLYGIFAENGAADSERGEELPVFAPAPAAQEGPRADVHPDRLPRSRIPRVLFAVGVVVVLAFALFALWPNDARVPDIPTAEQNAAPTGAPVGADTIPTPAVSPTEVPRASAPSVRQQPVRAVPETSAMLARRPTSPNVLRAVLALLLLSSVAWAIYEWYCYLRRPLGLGRERHAPAPFSWPIRVPTVRDVYRDVPEITEAARVIRTREASESSRLSVEHTIQATIAARGIPTFRYKSVTRSPDYLVLIERTTLVDHQAHLYAELSSSLAREGVHITRFYYDGDPRVCFDEANNEAMLLVDLGHRYSAHRLLVFGSGNQLIDPVTMIEHPWVEGLMGWRDRVLLTPVPIRQWGLRERVLARWFIVLPASVAGVFAAGELLLSPDRSEGPARQPGSHDRAIPKVSAANAALVLRDYLNNDAFQWLCACALYPELHWDLTLFIGSLPCMPARVVTEENLLRLIRLPWFRSGAIPDDIRVELIRALPRDISVAVHSALVQVLEQNPPPPHSAVAPSYQLNIAMQRLFSDPDDTSRKSEVKRLMAAVPERELLRDQVFLRLLEQGALGSPAFLLPRRLRKALYRRGKRSLGSLAPRRRAVAGNVRMRRLRMSMITTSATILIFAAFFAGVATSWVRNRALATKVADATRGVLTLPVRQSTPGTIAYPSLQALQQLEALRVQLDSVRGYLRDGPPLSMRFGLWKGPAVFEAARRVWYDGFRNQLFAVGWGAMVDSLKALPVNPTPASDQQTVYNWLKAYLITTSFPDSSNKEFLAPVLLTSSLRGQTMAPEEVDLARRQFEFYASELPSYNPWPAATDVPLRNRTRAFLARFADSEQIYRNMIAQAEMAPAARLPQAPGVFTVTPQVNGAYTPAGAVAMEAAFRNVNQYIAGETWVVGRQMPARTGDIASVVATLRARYRDAYARAWLQVLRTVNFVKPTSVKDAATKLGMLGGNNSALLELFRTVAENTSADSVVREVFGLIRTVSSPKAISRTENLEYLLALRALAIVLARLDSMPKPIDSISVAAFSRAANAASADVQYARVRVERLASEFPYAFVAQDGQLQLEAMRALSMARRFEERGDIKAAIAMYQKSLQLNGASGTIPASVGAVVKRLLLEPVVGAESVLIAAASLRPRPPVAPGGEPAPRPTNPAVALNENGARLCSDVTPLLNKFPFNADATSEASIDEVTAMFAPGTGKLWMFHQNYLAPFLERTGGKWVAKSAKGITLSPVFVDYFNRAALMSAALFSESNTRPQLQWKARAIISDQTPLVSFKHGGDESHFDKKTPQNIVNWPQPAGSSATLEATFAKNKPSLVSTATGEWALFRLVAKGASEIAGRQVRVVWPATTAKNAQPVVMEFELIDPPGVPVLKKGWLGGLNCAAQVTQ